MEFVIGFGGTLLCLLLLCGGVVVGWKLKAADDKRTQRVTAEQLTEKQRQALREEQEAWRELHSYSADVAYDLPRKERPEKE